MIIDPPQSQQEISNIQTFNCNGKFFESMDCTLGFVKKTENNIVSDNIVNNKKLTNVIFSSVEEYRRKITELQDIHFKDVRKIDRIKELLSKDSLRNVLKVFLLTFPKIGYLQGLNSIAGIFLLHFDEETSYWMIVSLMFKY